MKKILALALAFGVMSTANAKNEPLKEVSQIVEIPNFEQKKIFDASKIWMAETFKSANAVIQYEDVSTGTIVGKGNMDYPCEGFLKCAAHSNQLIAFTLKIDTKDNKARVTFYSKEDGQNLTRVCALWTTVQVGALTIRTIDFIRGTLRAIKRIMYSACYLNR